MSSNSRPLCHAVYGHTISEISLRCTRQFLIYFSKYAYQSITTDVWKKELYSFFADKKAVLDTIPWQKWLLEPGMPPKPNLAAEWTSAPDGAPPAESSAFEKMSPTQKVATLDKIRLSGRFTAAKMPALTSSFKLDEAKNCELKFSWLMLGLDTQWSPIIPKALAFVLSTTDRLISGNCSRMCQCHRPRRDPCSAANNHDVVVTHTVIKWEVHFQLKMLIGQVTLTCSMLRKTDKIVSQVRILLDVRELSIRSVTVNGTVVDYRIAPNVYTFFGSKMTIYLPIEFQEEGRELLVAKFVHLARFLNSIQYFRSVIVIYSTSPDATALQWMKKEQTADKTAPYLFSQCQAIHARSVVPCMDTPSVKSTYEAQVLFRLALSQFSPILPTKKHIPTHITNQNCCFFLKAGDRSLVSVIAHEIAHSWSGNLVTNSSWEHFWLNEGFTMFIERKICGRLVSEDYRQFMAFNGWTNALMPAVYEQFTPTHQFTKLIQDHTNVDPDVAFSCVPYEKGSALLFYLEQKLGGAVTRMEVIQKITYVFLSEVFEAYLRDYINTFAHKAIDSYQWKKHLYEYFNVCFVCYGQTMIVACEALFKLWIEVDEEQADKITDDTYKCMQPLQQIEFISQLWQHDPPLEHWKLEALNNLYGLNNSENCEILLNWIRLCIKAKWEPIIEKALKFVTSQGRLKYCRPVYRDLTGWPAAKSRARDSYIKSRSSMHPITAEMIAKDLHMRHSTHTVCF
ncbi:peptidase family M1 [Necator americanus]|uniref:Peptidase family M1 n=1 Tax=Necator americanus TaxID=51031 RepID=W2TNG7_NECAM|nr:peptidase family M1 [Necator americanus]ETN83219.1 peptidase family M1 [Necator americanus]